MDTKHTPGPWIVTKTHGAARDLACEAALDLLSLSCDTPSRAAIPQLRAAIAAAKGGEA